MKIVYAINFYIKRNVYYRFDKREEAQEAIAALNNVIPEGGTEPLSVKVCNYKNNLSISIK